MNSLVPHTAGNATYSTQVEIGRDSGRTKENPHFLLFAETGPDSGKGTPEACLGLRVPESLSGAWRFVLRSVDGAKYFEAADVEPEVFGDRLDLLTLVRALESLDQPSKVTLIGCSNYIRQGIQYGVAEWRANDWLWEWFGQMVPVKNADLWQRLDRSLAFHEVECGLRRIDAAHPLKAMLGDSASRETPSGGLRGAAKAWSSAMRKTKDAGETVRHFVLSQAKTLRTLWSGLSRKRDWNLSVAE